MSVWDACDTVKPKHAPTAEPHLPQTTGPNERARRFRAQTPFLPRTGPRRANPRAPRPSRHDRRGRRIPCGGPRCRSPATSPLPDARPPGWKDSFGRQSAVADCQSSGALSAGIAIAPRRRVGLFARFLFPDLVAYIFVFLILVFFILVFLILVFFTFVFFGLIFFILVFFILVLFELVLFLVLFVYVFFLFAFVFILLIFFVLILFRFLLFVLALFSFIFVLILFVLILFVLVLFGSSSSLLFAFVFFVFVFFGFVFFVFIFFVVISILFRLLIVFTFAV